MVEIFSKLFYSFTLSYTVPWWFQDIGFPYKLSLSQKTIMVWKCFNLNQHDTKLWGLWYSTSEEKPVCFSTNYQGSAMTRNTWQPTADRQLYQFTINQGRMANNYIIKSFSVGHIMHSEELSIFNCAKRYKNGENMILRNTLTNQKERAKQ